MAADKRTSREAAGAAQARQPRRSGGRPTREQAQQRHLQLLDVALEQFLEKGFELTTIEAVAAAVGMTKRTVYHLYEDKRALFQAAALRAIERWIVSVDQLRAIDTTDLEEGLTAVARALMRNALSPDGLRVMHIVSAESDRFPDVFHAARRHGALPVIDYLARLIRHHADAGLVRVESPELAATAFLSMVVGAPSRTLPWGRNAADAALEERARLYVGLFLDGVRVR